MSKKTSAVCMGAGIVLAIGSFNIAEANSHNRHKGHKEAARQEIRDDWREIRKDKAELRKDISELHRDRFELQKAVRRGAGKAEIARLRTEIRQDKKEIRNGRREIREDYAELRRDLNKYGWRGRPAGQDSRFDRGGNHWGNHGRHGWWDRDRHSRWHRGYYRR